MMDNQEKLVELLKTVPTRNGYTDLEDIANHLIQNGVTVRDVPDIIVGKWISVKDRLPEENEYVMIWCGECQIARIEKGISEEQRKAMKRGELDDPCEISWTLSSGYFTIKRSQSYRACDEQGNNRVPYCWYANGGPMKWFGQEVTHWQYLPQPPKGETIYCKDCENLVFSDCYGECAKGHKGIVNPNDTCTL